jgi:hypothetical protein
MIADQDDLISVDPLFQRHLRSRLSVEKMNADNAEK